MRGALQKLGMGALLALAVALLLKDPIIKTAVSAVGSHAMGAPVKVRSVSVGVFQPAVKIKGFQIHNPRGFVQEPFVDIPEVSVRYHPWALLRGRLHIVSLTLRVNEMVVVRNREGALNVEELKMIKQRGDGKDRARQDKSKTAATRETDDAKRSARTNGSEQPTRGAMPLRIDTMTLDIGRVVFKDYTAGDQPSIKVYEVPLKEKTFKEITSVQQLVVLVVAQALGPTAIRSVGVNAATTLLGVGFLPAAAAGMILGKDSATREFHESFNTVYRACLDVVKDAGTLTSEDRKAGMIKARVDGCRIVLLIEQQGRAVRVQAIGRKFMLPKPAVAGGVLYRIAERLE